MPDPIIIVEYDPEWPVAFERIRSRVAAGLGDLAEHIEHVGSTSVPGLPAKPIIDIDVVVADESRKPDAIRLLAELGYEHQGDLGITGREAFKPPLRGVYHHLYLVVEGARELRRHIAFRDWLRVDLESRQEYSELKKRLAEQFSNHRDGYSVAKTDFIEGVLARHAQLDA